MTDQSSRDNLDDNMRKVAEAATGKKGPSEAPSGESQAAGFSLPFGLGKKKKKEEPKAAAAPTPAPAPAEVAPAAPAAKTARTHTVKKGDTLWDIAASYYGDGRQFQKIAQANNISNPNVINIGTVLTIPE